MVFRTRFKIGAMTAAAILSWFALATMLAEAVTPGPRGLSASPAQPAAHAASAGAEWLAAAAPLRGDLLADVAWARALPQLQTTAVPLSSGDLEQRERALALARESLRLAPHASGTWLLLAMLRNLQPTAGSVAQALKMSYLTSPADIGLIPVRLSILVASEALDDSQLADLARHDVRLVLTRRPDLKDVIARAYDQGSAKGRAFLQETTQALDPGFAARLR
jgi:hypothetical protein